MGNRYDVGLAIKQQALTNIIDNPENSNDIQKCFEDVEIHAKSNNGNHMFIWTSTKWNESYEDVAALMRGLSSLDESNFLLTIVGINAQVIGGWYDNDFSLSHVCNLIYDEDMINE